MIWIIAAVALVLAVLNLIPKLGNSVLLNVAVILLALAFLAQSYGVH